jgi:type II secretory pathway pseudopilin PulG
MIELLIVIAVLGTLMAVVVVALNPLQRLAQAKDVGRKSTVTQLGRALDAYAVNNSSAYVAENATWITSLVTSGDITTVPSAVAYSVSGISACSVNVQNGYCYKATTAAGGGPVVVYARLEATADNSRCAAATPAAWTVYSSADGRGGIVCTAAASAPVPGNQTFLP